MGFHLSFLLKLHEFKSTDGSTTLMRILIRTLGRIDHKYLLLNEDLTKIPIVSKLSLTKISQEIAEMKKNLATIDLELQLERDDTVDHYKTVFRPFYKEAQEKIKNLSILFKETNEIIQDTMEYLMEDPTSPVDEFFSKINDFLTSFVKTVKDAQNSFLINNTGTPKKNVPGLTPTPFAQLKQEKNGGVLDNIDKKIKGGTMFRQNRLVIQEQIKHEQVKQEQLLKKIFLLQKKKWWRSRQH